MSSALIYVHLQQEYSKGSLVLRRCDGQQLSSEASTNAAFINGRTSTVKKAQESDEGETGKEEAEEREADEGRLAREGLTRGRLARGRLAKGRLTRGRLTRGRLTKGALTAAFGGRMS